MSILSTKMGGGTIPPIRHIDAQEIAETPRGFRILFLHSFIGETDGSSLAIRGLLRDNKSIVHYKILSLHANGTLGLNVRIVSSWHDILDEIESGKYDFIHYFKIAGYSLFLWTKKALCKSSIKLPIYTTVNQKPSYKGLLLSPLEIQSSEKIIFIDSTAYADAVIRFVPVERKERIYYVTSSYSFLEQIYQERCKLKATPSPHIIFGRGSSASKCPMDMFDIFHRIPYADKEFRVVGIPPQSPIAIEGNKYDDVTVLPTLPTQEWYRKLMEFDVFLYQIPEDCHSSLDGTLGAAMRLGIPVVYYGSEAPKERFTHGIDGYVAKTKNDIPKYCQVLASDANFRRQMGEAGRISTLQKFSWQDTVRNYTRVWSTPPFENRINVPLWYRLYFWKTSLLSVIRDRIRWNPSAGTQLLVNLINKNWGGYLTECNPIECDSPVEPLQDKGTCSHSDEAPLVTIRCLTYNHEPYIRQCLEGFVMQRTTFRFEAVVHDDASTDGTASIIQEFAARYPDIIKPILETENQYSKKDGSLRRIMNAQMRGKYIAFCEGDDYWIDPLKLQKQVDFLEANPDYGLCYTDFNIVYQGQRKTKYDVFKNYPKLYPKFYTPAEWIYCGGYVCPPSWVMRKDCYPFDPIPSMDGSFVLFSHFLCTSKVHLIEDTTCVYRSLKESASHSADANKMYRRAVNLCDTKLRLIDHYHICDAERLKDRCRYLFYAASLPSLVAYHRDADVEYARKLLTYTHRNRILFAIQTLHLQKLLRWILKFRREY